jgi:hypothetical protein
MPNRFAFRRDSLDLSRSIPNEHQAKQRHPGWRATQPTVSSAHRLGRGSDSDLSRD